MKEQEMKKKATIKNKINLNELVHGADPFNQAVPSNESSTNDNPFKRL